MDRAGPYGGFLGQAFDPIFTEFVGQATRKATKTLNEQTWEDVEPYRGITPESRFRLGGLEGGDQVPPPPMSVAGLELFYEVRGHQPRPEKCSQVAADEAHAPRNYTRPPGPTSIVAKQAALSS